MKRPLILGVALAALSTPLEAHAQEGLGAFEATSIGVGSPFALKGSAWGSLSLEQGRLVVAVDSLVLWRDPARGRDGGPRTVASIGVGLASGSVALNWSTVARSGAQPVEEVLDLDESAWRYGLQFEIPLPPGTETGDLLERWIVFTAYDGGSGSSNFHSRVRLSGRPVASLEGPPADYREGLARVLDVEEVVAGRAISIVSGGEIHDAIRAEAAARGIPICSYVSASAAGRPSFRIRGLIPRTADAFAARVSQFDADGGFGASLTVELVRLEGGGWGATVGERMEPSAQGPRPAGQSFCHDGGGGF